VVVYLHLRVQQLHEGAWVVSSSVTAPTIDPGHVRHKNSSNLPIRLEKFVICLPSLLLLRRGYSMILATRDGMNPPNPHQCLGMDLPGVNLLVSHRKRNASRVCGRIHCPELGFQFEELDQDGIGSERRDCQGDNDVFY
jgi:hypothetical protein